MQIIIIITDRVKAPTKWSGLYFVIYSTVTDFARFLGLSTSQPFAIET